MRRVAVLVSTCVVSLLLWAQGAVAASYNLYLCGGWSTTAGPLVPAYVGGTLAEAVDCGGANADLEITRLTYQPVPRGKGASWTTTAPTGLSITHIFTVNDNSYNVGSGNGWWGEFFWNGGPGLDGRSGQMTESFRTYGCCQAFFNDRTVGWFMACGWSSCTQPGGIDVGGVDLTVNEEQGPWLRSPSGLWQASSWVRDRWPLVFSGDSPSGVCSLSASINGQAVTLGPSAAVGKNTTTWHQCSGASASTTIQTADYGQGPVPLTIEGCDAAGVCTNNAYYTKAVEVDNSHPSVSLQSPGDAPTTAGAQYVTATAGGSPSGIAEIDCSVDGRPTERYVEGGALQPTAQVPVSGLGEHTIQCSAANMAVAQDGSHGVSTAPATTTLKIGEPTVAAISFLKLVDGLRCSRVRDRIRVPARWVTVHRHHRPVWVLRGPRTKVVKVMRCHARTARRPVTVWVTVRRHGRKVRVRREKFARVVLVPHVVSQTTRRVLHGRGTTVSGWLGTTSGVALGGQAVRVLTAPDNNLGQFSQAAGATTAADGGWTAQLPPGPSRLVEAVYDGGSTTEPSASTQVRLIVPAKVRLIGVFPPRVAWGGTVRIVGQLEGGYLPAGGALVRLRIGSGSSFTTFGVQEHVTGSGRFSTSYTFGAGEASVYQSFWLQIASLPMGNYPWAPANSGKRSVLVGGHPVIAASPLGRHKRRHHRHAGRRKR